MNISEYRKNVTLFVNSSNSFDFGDISKIDYIGQFKDIPLPEVVLKILLFVLIIVTAVVGNILIIVVVAWNKRLRTTTNYYIVNLAVSDLFVTICCSWVYLVTHLTDGFILGPFFCKFNTFAQGKLRNCF